MGILKSGFFIGIVLLLWSCNANKQSAQKQSAKVLPQSLQVAATSHFLDGQRYKLLGDYTKASESFQRCLQIDAQNDAAYYELANIYDYSGAIPLAIQYTAKAHELSPSNKWYLVQLAGLNMKIKNFEGAEEAYKKLVALYPSDLNFNLELANVYIYSQKLKEAIKVYDNMEERYGVNEDFNLRKKRIYENQRDYDKAIIETEKLINAYPKELKYYTMLAELYQTQGNSEKALEIYERLLKIEPNNPFVQFSLSEYYSNAGRHQEADEMVKQAFSNPEMDIDTKVQILLNMYTVGQRDSTKRKRVINLAKDAVETHPESAKAKALYGDFLYREEDFLGAKTQYESALNIEKGQFLIWSQLMFVYIELDSINSLEQKSAEAMNLFPLQPTFYFFNGVAHLQLKQYAKAISVLEEGKGLVVENDALLSQFYANLGDAYYNNKQSAEAYMRYDACLEIDQNNYVVMNNYAYYLSLEKVNLIRAEELSKKTIVQFPNSSTYLDTYAWIRYQQGEYADAKKYMQKALENGGDKSAVIVEHFGDILYKLGDKDGAIDYWKKAQAIGEGSEYLNEKVQKSTLIE